MKIAILANGDSLKNYTLNPLGIKYDQVWGLNQMATWVNPDDREDKNPLNLDKLFVMDDLKLRMPFYAGYDFVNFLKTYPIEIVTSRAYPEWPTSVDYPLYEVCQYFGVPAGIAMYSTPDYMIALAVMKGATEIHLPGVDMNDKTMHEMRIGTAHWIGVAQARGVLVKTYTGSMFQYLTNPGHGMECGLYGYVKRPRIEDLVNKSYYKAYENESS